MPALEPRADAAVELDAGAVLHVRTGALGQRDAGDAGRDAGADRADPRHPDRRDAPPPLVGLVYPQREPMAPLTAALVTEAQRLGQAWMGSAAAAR